MKGRWWMLGGAVLVGLMLTGCPMGPKKFCKQLGKESCKYTKECARAEFERSYSSLSDCRYDFEQAWECDSIEEADFCLSAEDYDPGKAGICIRKLGGVDCSATMEPEACAEICG